jgi:hypothetical protein
VFEPEAVDVGGRRECRWQKNGREVASIAVQVEPHRVVLWYGIRGPGKKYEQFREPVYLEFSPCNYAPAT